MHNRHLLTCVCLAALLLVIIPGSAYTWSDHFTSDTSANYDGKISAYTWNTGLTTGWLNCTNPAGHRILHYKNEKFGGGWFNYSYTDYGGSSWPYIIWGDVSSSDTGDSGNPTTSGTKYGCRAWPSAWSVLECFKVVGGVYTELGETSYSVDYHYNISIFWDPATGDIHVYEDDINLRLDLNDNAITDPGYMGVSYYSPSDQQVGWDIWNYANETGDSAPVAAFTGSPRAGVRNATITLTDESTNTPTSWFWWAPSTGTPCHNNATLEVTNQNPVIFPKNFGYCGICLTATNAGGSGSTCKPNYLYIAQPQAVIA